MKRMTLIDRLITTVVSPFRKHMFLYVFLTSILILPNIYFHFVIASGELLRTLVQSIISDSFVIYLMLGLVLITEHLNIKVAKLVLISFFVVLCFNLILYSLSILLFYDKDYHFMLRVIYETSVEEILDFISFYKVVFLGGVTMLIILISVFVYLLKKEKPINLNRFISVLLFLFVLGHLKFYFREPHYGSIDNFCHMTHRICRDYNIYKMVGESNQNLCNDSCEYCSSNIVLIIGESFNKYHSNLYGYDKNTSPRLKEKNNLYVFNDVITPVNYTFAAFSHFLSVSSVDQHVKWYESPLFPCLFREANYNVLWWDNASASCSYIEKSSIDFHNKKNIKKYTFDNELIEDYQRNRPLVENDSMNLVMFHFVGQHYDYQNRYPLDRTYFTVNDYENRKDLDEKQKLVVSYYDNAVRYNDSIVANIIDLYRDKDAIVIYFSDHGEEVYDYRNMSGRSTYCKENMEAWMHCQIDIPFIVWVSDLYKEMHPDIVEKIESSVNKPFMTDDLPHLLFDIAGVKNRWFNPQRSVINDSFDVSRKRIVSDWNEKEFKVYDSVCTNISSWKIGWSNN